MGPSKELPEYLKLNVVAISQDHSCQPDDKSGMHQKGIIHGIPKNEHGEISCKTGHLSKLAQEKSEKKPRDGWHVCKIFLMPEVLLNYSVVRSK